jgi:hypothetical protein
MFVLSEKGDVYVYKISETLPTREDMEMFSARGAR